MTDMATKFPLPPDELIDRVVSGFANEDAANHRAMFLQTGKRSVEDLARALGAAGERLDSHQRILEFGCGCGRIMRWMEELSVGRELVGTDIDRAAIEWASENLPFATFHVNEGLPPLRYPDATFDLVVNHSVFTHLDEAYQDRWLAELQRIVAPGGTLVLTVHGPHAFAVSESQLPAGSRESGEWRAQLERDGILFVAADAYVGSAFPDFYHTTYHAPWYVLSHWSEWFDVLGYLPRGDLDHQDQVVLRRREEGARRDPPVGVSGADRMAPAQSATPARDAVPVSLEVPDVPSRFGPAGLIARRVLFRLARPVLDGQRSVNRTVSESLLQLNKRLDERMPPVVHVALRNQAERIDRLEAELRRLRRGEDG